jgi:hypothetical protein
MLATIRRNRWMIALLLLLFGQAGVVLASAAPTCPRSHDAAPASLVLAAGAAEGALAHHKLADAAADHEHGAASDPLSTLPPVPGCGASALPASAGGIVDPPLSGAGPLLDRDTALPGPLVHAFFRPPQLS